MWGVLVPVFGSVALFAFLAVAVWATSRRKERESYYQYEFRKRLVDAGKLDADDVRALVEFEHTSELTRTRTGLQVSGVVLTGAGAGMLLGLRFIEGESVWMVGYIPLFIGLAMLAFGFLMARPDHDRPLAVRRDRPSTD